MANLKIVCYVLFAGCRTRRTVAISCVVGVEAKSGRALLFEHLAELRVSRDPQRFRCQSQASEVTASKQTITVELAPCSTKGNNHCARRFYVNSQNADPFARRTGRRADPEFVASTEGTVRHACSTSSHAVRPHAEFAALTHNINSLTPHTEIMSNFDPNAILRGAQLTLVGGTTHRRLILDSYPLTCACSQSCPPKPRTIHIRSLPTSSSRCGCWCCYSNSRICTCMSAPLKRPLHL
jgi:hypothetical protein